MPIYEYECDECGHVFEALQSFSEKPLKMCTKCSGKVHKLISQSAFHLKGSGWYVTDYAKKSSNAPPAAKSKDSSGSGSSEKSKTSGGTGSTSD